tara:strand:+ start:1812 stop:1973 length:162 start_codon:yes stop_codon:yes gene_type:complete
MRNLNVSEQQKLNDILLNHKESGDIIEKRIYTTLLVKLLKTKIKKSKELLGNV